MLKKEVADLHGQVQAMGRETNYENEYDYNRESEFESELSKQLHGQELNALEVPNASQPIQELNEVIRRSSFISGVDRNSN